jgi:Zn-dependent protease/CBS domain-containing protein
VSHRLARSADAHDMWDGSRNGKHVGWSFNLGSFGGTQVRVHVTFVLLLAWIWFTQYQAGGTAAAWQGVAFSLAVFACVVLHEFGHALAARRYGIRTPDITLLPIGGLARLERMPEQPLQELVIAIAGPLVNVVIAGIIVVALGYTIGLDEISQIDNPRADFLARLAGVNVFLVLFNLIPAFPMDGGRVLRALLAFWLPWARATRVAATIGQGFAVLFGVLGLFYSPLLLLIAIFVYLAAAGEAQHAQLRDVARNVLVSDVMITKFSSLQRSSTLDEAVELLLATTQQEFPVVDLNGRFEGLLTRNAMIRALRDAGPATPVASAMRTDIPVTHPSKTLRDSLRTMQAAAVPAMAVADDAGRLVGLMTHENLGEMLMVSAATEGFRFGRLRRGPGRAGL